MTITYKANDVEITFNNIDDFNKFWYYDSGNVSMRSANGLLEFNNDSISLWEAFHRQDCTLHRPQTETIDGEVWYVNDGKQPVKDDVKVEYILKKNKKYTWAAGALTWKKRDHSSDITHWRLAK